MWKIDGKRFFFFVRDRYRTSVDCAMQHTNGAIVVIGFKNPTLPGWERRAMVVSGSGAGNPMVSAVIFTPKDTPADATAALIRDIGTHVQVRPERAAVRMCPLGAIQLHAHLHGRGRGRGAGRALLSPRVRWSSHCVVPSMHFAKLAH